MRGPCILLVDDSADDLDLTMRALKRYNIANTFVVARDGAEALDYLFASGAYANREPDDMPTVILLDLRMPKIDGLEVLRRLRADERTRLLPVVVLTTSMEERDVVESFNLGANRYVRKPVDYVEFMELVREMGPYLLALNVSPPAQGRS